MAFADFTSVFLFICSLAEVGPLLNKKIRSKHYERKNSLVCRSGGGIGLRLVRS